MSSAARVSVLVPTLDEAGNIDRLIREVLEHARAASLDLEVIVVDDGSRDGTRELVRAWETGHPVTLVARDGEKGLASAVLAGAARAGGDVVVVMDADISHPPARIADLARPVLEGSSDMVIGSRYVPGGSTPGWPLRRRIVSRGAAAAARVLIDARDPLAGFFAVRRGLLLDAAKDALGFKVGLEILVRAGDGLRLKEVPIAFKDRTAGRSKLGAAILALYLKQLVELAGGSVDARIGPALLAGLAADLCAFHALLAGGADLVYAHLGAYSISLLAAWFFSTRRPVPGAPGPGRPRALIAFTVIAFLGAPLRGGVLSSLVREMGWHPTLAFLPAMLLGGLVTGLGCMFLVFPPRGRPSAAVRWRAGAVAILAHAVLLRIFHAGLVDLASWAAAAGFSYLLARNLVDRSAGFRAALLMGSLPLFSGIGSLMAPSAPIAASWAGALRCAVLLITLMALAAFGFGISRRKASLGGAAPPSLDARGRLFVLVFTFVSLAILVLARLFGETGVQWTAPAWLAALPAIACGMIPGPGKVERWIASIWRPAVIGLAALHGAALHVWSFG